MTKPYIEITTNILSSMAGDNKLLVGISSSRLGMKWILISKVICAKSLAT